MEPDWAGLEKLLRSMTVVNLRKLGRTWFMGALGGASTKRDIAQEMVAQMRHWWRSCADNGGRERVDDVLRDIVRLAGDAE